MRSARANNNEIIDFISLVKPSIIGIQETWGFNVKLQGYSFISNHRPKKGGGVSIIYKNSMKLKLLCKLMTPNTEAVLGCNSNLVIINIYRPPKGDIQMFGKDIKNVLDDLRTDPRKKILMGDFNIDFSVANRQSQLITDICLDHDLIMPHKTPSRETQHSATTIDGIFSNSQHTVGTGTFTFLTTIAHL